MTYETPNFKALEELYDQSVRRGVSFALQYNESDDTFYVTIDSIDPTYKGYISKSTDLHSAVRHAVLFLTKPIPADH